MQRLAKLGRKRKLLLLKQRLSIWTRHYLTRECLPAPNECAWTSLFNNGTENSFVHVTSLSRRAFNDSCKRHYGLW